MASPQEVPTLPASETKQALEKSDSQPTPSINHAEHSIFEEEEPKVAWSTILAVFVRLNYAFMILTSTNTSITSSWA